MPIMTDIVNELRSGATLTHVLRAQHSHHELRRWSSDRLFDGRRLTRPDENDKAALRHAARTELTTRPSGVRLALDGTRLAHEIRESNPLGSDVLHVAAAWSARYWLEEEAHHEVSLGRLMEMAGIDPISEEGADEHHRTFPSDNYARICVLQACLEIEACVSYQHAARTSNDELVRDVFHRIVKDEVQHRQYFASFAKALVESGVHPVKDVLSMAYLWIRPDSGETFGPTPETWPGHQDFANRPEPIRTDREVLAPGGDTSPEGVVNAQRSSSVFALVREVTGIEIRSYEELKRAYFASLRTNRVDRIRSAVGPGTHPAAALTG